MKIYIVRHGEAKDGKEDFERVLTDKGIEDIKKIGLFLSKLNLNISKIYHSTKLRAKQTAEILNNFIKSKDGLIEISGLEPNADIYLLLEKFLNEKDDYLIVGHLPYLSKLISYLLCKDQEKLNLKLEAASVLCMENYAENNFGIKFYIIPEII